MLTIRETRLYRVESEGNGLFVLIVRKRDGASMFLRGDEAGELLDDIEHASDHIFNLACNEYDSAMELPR